MSLEELLQGPNKELPGWNVGQSISLHGSKYNNGLTLRSSINAINKLQTHQARKMPIITHKHETKMFDVDPDTCSSFKFLKKLHEKILVFASQTITEKCKDTFEINNDPTGLNNSFNLRSFYVNFSHEFIYCKKSTFKCLLYFRLLESVS